MKKVILLVFIFLTQIAFTQAQGLCDLPSVMTMYDIPLHWSLPIGSGKLPLKPKKSIVIHEKINFIIPDFGFDIDILEIDFRDGQGWNEYSANEIVEITYNTTGVKTIDYRYMWGAYSDVDSGFFKIDIKPTTDTYSPPDAIWTIETEATFTPPISGIYPPDSEFGTNEISSAIACIRFAEGNTQLTKPIIFVTGYDPGEVTLTDPDLPAGENIIRHGGNGWDVFIRGADELFVDALLDTEVFREYPQTMSSLSQMGHDIIFLDFENGGDYLQKNAELLIELLKRVNEEKVADESGSIQPNVVIGASMGGLITRYALKTMENRNIPHCTETFVAFDSPMKGATAPVGVQGAMWFNHAAGQNTPETTDDQCASREWRALETPAAKQLLENHLGRLYEEGSVSLSIRYFFDDSFVFENNGWLSMGTGYTALREQWIEEFENLGYPEKCKRVAIACGNQRGMGQGYQQGAVLFNGALKANTALGERDILRMGILAGQGLSVVQSCNNFCIDLGNNPSHSSPQAVFAAINPHIEGEGTITLAGILPEGICSYHLGKVELLEDIPFFDGAPGANRADLLGLRNQLERLADENPDITAPISIPSGNESLSFVPTVSALDIEGEFSDELLFMDILNNDIVNNNLTPFDNYHAPQGIINLKHVEIDEDIRTFLLNELPTWSTHPSIVLNNGERFNHGMKERSLSNTVVNNGGVLAVNGGGATGFGGGVATDASSTVKASSFFGCVETNITVNDGGLFQIGMVDNSRNGVVTIHDNSTVHINSGGRLRIVSNSQLIIEEGATLILDAGTTVDLWWDESTIHIKEGGRLIINGDINFTGGGFLQFDEGNILEVTSDALSLEGDNENTRLIRLNEDASLLIPSGVNLSIQNAKIIYRDDSKILARDCDIAIQYTKFESEDPQNKGKAGIEGTDIGRLGVYTSEFRNLFFGLNIEFNSLAGTKEVRWSRFNNNNVGAAITNASNYVNFSECGFKNANNSYAAIALKNCEQQVRVADCEIQGGEIDYTNEQNSPVNFSDYVQPNTGIRLRNVQNLNMVNSTISNCSIGINGQEDEENNLVTQNNITMFNGSTIQACAVGIRINGHRFIEEPDLDFGSVFMDCARLIDNRVGVQGTDVLLLIDALDNAGEGRPRPNAFSKRRKTDFFFDICLNTRADDFITDGLSARGNYWNYLPHVLSNPPHYFFKAECLGGDNLEIDYSSNVDEIPEKCTSESGPQHPDDDDVAEYIDANCPELTLNTSQRYLHGAFYILHEDWDAALMSLDSIAKVPEAMRTNADSKCRIAIDFARTYVPKQASTSGYVQQENQGNSDINKGKNATNSSSLFAKIYPNPTNGISELKMPEGSYQLSVFDALGRLVLKQHFTSSTKIDLNDKESGLYIVKIQSYNTKEVKVLKLVKE